jgi:hypothetical protein
MYIREIGLEVNADKTKCMVVSQDKNAGQNSTQEQIKNRFKSGNACYHSVQKLLSSSLLSKNLKIKIY